MEGGEKIEDERKYKNASEDAGEKKITNMSHMSRL